MSSSLLQHLLELRRSLLNTALGILIVFLGLSYWSSAIYTWVATPLIDALPEAMHMVAIDVTSPLFVPFKLTFFLAFLMSLPFTLLQIWRFILPGLYRHEKRTLGMLLWLSTLLFYAGVSFSYSFVLPLTLDFIIDFMPDGVHMSTDIGHYLSFVTKLLLGFGCAFEIPVFVCCMCWVGIVNVTWLKSKRPYVIVLAFTVAMFLTPPDVLSQCLLAIPMLFLYEFGLLLAQWLKPSMESFGFDASASRHSS